MNTPPTVLTSSLPLLALLTCSCIGNSGGDSVSPPEAPFDRLQDEPMTLYLDRDQSAVSVVARVNHGHGWHEVAADLDVAWGELTLRIDDDGELYFDDLFVSLEDVLVSADGDVLTEDVAFTGLEVSTDASPGHVLVDWAEDGSRCDGRVDLGLGLSWNMRTGPEEPMPLGRQRLDVLSAHLTLFEEGEFASAELTLQAPGTFWSWGSMAELSDLSLSVRAREMGGLEFLPVR